MECTRPNVIAYHAACIRKEITNKELAKIGVIKMEYCEKNLQEYINDRKSKSQSFTAK